MLRPFVDIAQQLPFFILRVATAGRPTPSVANGDNAFLGQLLLTEPINSIAGRCKMPAIAQLELRTRRELRALSMCVGSLRTEDRRRGWPAQ